MAEPWPSLNVDRSPQHPHQSSAQLVAVAQPQQPFVVYSYAAQTAGEAAI
ncbi:MAG: hypothetical protein AAGF01_31095 [Cyanobacteria bacterium P01_G01_bin.38]